MNTIFILFVITHVYMGITVTTQEFYSLQQCQMVAEHLAKYSDINGAWCVKK